MTIEFENTAGGQGEAESNTVDNGDVEHEARQLGWVPKDEFSGKEAHWVDADSFLERGQQILPILKQNNKQLKEQLRESERKIAELALTVKESSAMFKTMSENAYKKAMSDIKGQIRQAQNNGDYDVADQLTDQYDQLREDSKNLATPTVASVDPRQAEWEGVIEDWKDETTWYGKDKTLTRQMDAIARELAAEDKSLLGTRRLLEKAEKQLREEMPEKFQNTRRQAGSPVAGSSSSSAGARGTSSSVRDLPAEAKKSGERMVKNGMFKDMAEYAKAYFDDTNGIIA